MVPGSRDRAWSNPGGLRENGRVVIEERAHLLARIPDEAVLAAAAAAAAGHTGSAVDELIAARRTEAAREDRAHPAAAATGLCSVGLTVHPSPRPTPPVATVMADACHRRLTTCHDEACIG